MTRLHVCVLTADFPRTGAPDAGAFVHTLWSEAQSQGAKVNVVAPTRYPIRATRSGIESGLRVSRPGYFTPGVAAPFAAHRRRWSLRGWTNAAAASVAGQELPDVFFGQFLFPAGQAASLLAARFDRPSFVEISENSTGIDGWFHAHSKQEVQDLLLSFTGIIAVSDELAAMLTENFGVPAGRILVSRNGIDHRLFAPGGPRAEEEPPASHQPIRTVTVARHHPVKGVQLVADAIDSLDGVRGLFVGDGPHPPTGDRIELCGSVAHDRIPSHLRRGDIFVLPSTSEGCANAVLEAMAVGLPLILSDRPFMHEIADESFATFVDPTSSSEIASAIAELAADPTNRRERGKRARETAMQFRIDDRAKAILSWMSGQPARSGRG